MAAETIRELILAGRKRLLQHHIDDASFNADCLAALILGVNNGRLPGFWEKTASPEFAEQFSSLIERRCQHEPLQYLAGEWGFLDFEVRVGPGALIPRPETEEVFMAASREIDKKPFRESFKFADIGTGTGILGLAMARRFKFSEGFLVDISADALAIAGENLRRFPEVADRLALVQGNLLEGFVPHSLQVIVSNPPYITADEVPHLQAEVSRFEPHLALDGGPTGIELIKRLVVQAELVLVRGGLLIFEHGHGQRSELQKLTGDRWLTLQAADDLCGRERFFILERL